MDSPSGRSTGLTTDSAVPTIEAGSTNASADAGEVAAMDGVSLRWRHDRRRCLARTSVTPQQGDPLVLSTCASDRRQAFNIQASVVMATANLCVAASSRGGPVVLDACTNTNTILYLAIGDDMVRAIGFGPQGYLVPSDAAGTPETPVELISSAPSETTEGQWDLVGVGDRGGALVAIPNDPLVFCLTRREEDIALAPCDRTAAEQRWRMDEGLLVNDTGRCLTCDETQSVCQWQHCQSATDQQRWRLSYSLQYLGSGVQTHVLTGDKTTRIVMLNGPGASNTWAFGGKVP